MIKLSKITVWSVITDKGEVKFNHIEDGWSFGDYPLPKDEQYTNQKSWAKMKWRKENGYLINNIVHKA